jgi:hypothetical protein
MSHHRALGVVGHPEEDEIAIMPKGKTEEWAIQCSCLAVGVGVCQEEQQEARHGTYIKLVGTSLLLSFSRKHECAEGVSVV